MAWNRIQRQTPTEELLEREWLVTNGLGGYASGSVAGVCTRRFHGLLVAALPSPFGRTMMLNHLREEVRGPHGATFLLAGEERPHPRDTPPEELLEEFRLELGLPVWRFHWGDILLEKRVMLPRHQNTVFIRYSLQSAPSPVRLRLRPSFNFR